MSEKDSKPRKIRRRRTTGRVGGTTQSAFASNAMSTMLEQQAKEQAKKEQAKEKAEAGKARKSDDADDADG